MVCDGTAVTASGARQVQTGAVGFDCLTRVLFVRTFMSGVVWFEIVCLFPCT